MTNNDGDNPDDPEEMLRQLLSTPPPPLSQPPQAKHKMYSKKAMRRKKESMRPAAPDTDALDDDPTEGVSEKPRHRTQSLRPPGVPKADK